MARVTPDEARTVLRDLADHVRARPRAWPASSKGRRALMNEAMAMAGNEAAHLWRVSELDDATLQRMLDGGWDPRDRGSASRHRDVS